MSKYDNLITLEFDWQQWSHKRFNERKWMTRNVWEVATEQQQKEYVALLIAHAPDICGTEDKIVCQKLE